MRGRRIDRRHFFDAVDWVKPALASLERGESLPLSDLGEAFRLLDADPDMRRTTVASYDGRHEHASQQHMAVPALWSAAADDPLRAGLESLFHALVTFAMDHRRLLSEVRDAFPELVERDPGGAGVVLGEPERLDAETTLESCAPDHASSFGDTNSRPYRGPASSILCMSL